MSNYAHIAARVLDKPLLLEPSYARIFFSALAERLDISSLNDAGGEVMAGEKMRMSAQDWSGVRSMAGSVTRTRTNRWGEVEVLYHVVDGVALIPVKGTLVHKSGFLNPSSGMTGYDGITFLASLAFADEAVEGVMLDNQTPGGEVSGCFDTSQQLRRMADNAGKPLWALCYDMNCSAGMALASAAHRRLITQTGQAGSVGVVMAHREMSKQMDKQGVTVTLIHSGDRKIDGNPFEALGDDVKARFQASSDQLRQEFAALMSAHMGLSVDSILATEAAIYRGQEAIDVGFADELVNGHDAIPMFSNHLSTQGKTISLGVEMPKDKLETEQAEEQDSAEMSTEQTADFRAEERDRIKTILNSDAAQGRTELASYFAYETEMGAAEAIAALAKAPSAAGNLDADTSLDAMMESADTPNLSADSESETETPSGDDKVVAEAVAAYRTAKGVAA